MRPVNLIPPEERRGDAAPGRTGALPWLVVGALVAAVAIVGVLVSTNNDISNKEAEVASLEQEEAELQARADSLAAFTNFQQIKVARVETVAALAESRFDWQRVMEELSRVIPANVWLVGLSGQSAAAEGTEPTGAVPTLEMTGCAVSQRAVARMVSAIGDIDGVTRVAATKSEKSETNAGGGGGGGAGGGGEATSTECRTRSYIAKFELTATFDGVAVPEGAVPDPATAPAPSASPTSEQSAGNDGGAGAARRARAQGAEEVADADQRVENAANIASGGGG